MIQSLTSSPKTGDKLTKERTNKMKRKNIANGAKATLTPKTKKATKKAKVQTTVNQDATWGTTGDNPIITNEEIKLAMADVQMGEMEATETEIQKDIERAENPEFAPIDPEQTGKFDDELTTSVVTWNNRNLIDIQLRENSNVLNRFEYIPTILTVNGKPTRYSILSCSDNGAIVGKPFADSYGLVNNSDFLGIIEQIITKIEQMGLKWKVATTGTLYDRERTFISLALGDTQAQSFIVDGREIKTFLNCLNSIPSNSGCTVTFANNTFCVCCRNTFAHVLHKADDTKFHAALKHSRNVKTNLQDIPVLVEAYFTGNQKLFKNLKAFSEFPVTLEECEQYFAAFLGRDSDNELTDKIELKPRSANIVENLKNLFVNGKGNKGQTAFDVFQAVTEFYTHFSATGQTKTGESKDAKKQFESSELGSGYVNKNDFYSWLVRHIQSKADFNGVCKVGDTLLVAYRKNRADGKFERKKD